MIVLEESCFVALRGLSALLKVLSPPMESAGIPLLPQRATQKQATDLFKMLYPPRNRATFGFSSRQMDIRINRDLVIAHFGLQLSAIGA